VSCRERRLIEQDADIGTALAKLSWKGIDQLLGTTSRQRLHLRILKGDRFSGWDRLHHRHGCPHCPTDTTGGHAQHIFWECSAAQELWGVLQDEWNGYRLWDGATTGPDFKAAVFDLRLPHFPAELWALSDLAQVPQSDETTTSEIHQAVHVAWQQQVRETLLVIWRWRHNIQDGVQQWTLERARLYLQGVLQAAIREVSRRLPPTKRLRDPRIQLLAELGRRRPTTVHPMMAETPTAAYPA
jgi:hypothetical protein